MGRTWTGAVLLAGLLPAQAMAVVDKYNITPAEHAACDADVARLCISVAADQDQVLQCMSANRQQLSQPCITAFEEGLKRRHIKID